MASWDRRDYYRATRIDWALGLVVILILVAGFVIVGTIEGHSRDPNTGCKQGQVLNKRGECK